MIKIKNILKDSRGVALLWSLLISMILLVIGTSLTLLVIKELRISTNIDESNRAYLAAEAGMEKGLYELQQNFDSDINWCGSENFSDNNIDSSGELGYETAIDCTIAGGIKEIIIESLGKDLDRTQRKLQTRLTFVDPTGRIQQFDADPGMDANGFYDLPNAGTIAPSSLIIQQFDLFDLDDLDGSFEVGLSQSKDDQSDDSTDNYVNVKFENTSVTVGGEAPSEDLCSGGGGGHGGGGGGHGGGDDDEDACEGSKKCCDVGGGKYECKKNCKTTTINGIKVSLIGKINDQDFEEDYFAFDPSDIDVDGDRYRVKIEYAKHGNFYVVTRVIVLPRRLDGSREGFSCMDSDNRDGREDFIDNIVFDGMPQPGFLPAFVKISDASHQVSGSNGYMSLPGGVQLDNMVFWGKE